MADTSSGSGGAPDSIHFSDLRRTTNRIESLGNYLRRGKTARRRGSRRQTLAHISTAKYIGRRVLPKREAPMRSCDTTAPPRYPVSRIAPSTDVDGMA